MLKKCNRCKDGVVDTGNNDLPCGCSKGSSALFNICDVEGLVTGAEDRRHFSNKSSEPIREWGDGKISASSLPGRNKDMREMKRIFRQFGGLFERFDPEESSQIKGLYTCAHHLHILTSKMLGK